MGFVNFILELLKDPRAAIAGWIAMGLSLIHISEPTRP